MISKVAFLICCLTTIYSRSQGYSGDFAVTDKQTVYHFTLVNGSLIDPVYTIKDETKYIHTMYLADSTLLAGIDSMLTGNKKDSLLRQFL